MTSRPARRWLALIAATTLAGACGGASAPKRTPPARSSSRPKPPPAPDPAPDPEPEPEPPSPRWSAVAELAPTKGSKVAGVVAFEQIGDELTITVDVTGLKKGKHGIHVHATGDCGGRDAKKAGPHFNPHVAKHGDPDGQEHHAGDLGNLEAGADGRATLERRTTELTLADGLTSIASRSIVIHAGEDDLKSQPIGRSGKAVACGVITLVEGGEAAE